MAVAAAETFDWEYAEAQFAQYALTDAAPETEGYMRPPGSEIYGRSLSTVRRLGAFMLRHTLGEAVSSPEAAQAKAEFYTSVEEGFGTDMELGGGLEVRAFDRALVIDGRVMSKDNKTPVSVMTKKGLECAEETAKKDPHFQPQLTRSYWDHENALIVDRMARGETRYKTRIVVSPFPEEGAKRSGDEYWRNIGYVPHLKRGFVQLYHVAQDGSLLTGSLSFSGSNKEKLREIFSEHGIEIPETEVTDNWLKYAITRTLTDEEAKAVATNIADGADDPRYKKIAKTKSTRCREVTNTVDVTREYGPIMERAFNESYVHICESLVRGYQTSELRELIYQFADKAHNFNERYASALYRMRADGGEFSEDDSIVLHELMVYSTIEMMRALHLEKLGSQYSSENARFSFVDLQSANAALFQGMLGSFGAVGAQNNRVYSACGLSISLGNEDRLDNPNGPQSPFGGHNKTLDEDNLGSRWFTCPKGHLNYRRVANVKEKNCRTCQVDISCEAPKTAKQKTNEPLTWERALGYEPVLIKSKAVLGRRALVGAGA